MPKLRMKKITLVGARGVGKTQLAARMVGLPFSPEHLEEVGVSNYIDQGHQFLIHATSIPIDRDKKSDDFINIPLSYVRDAGVVFLVFDVTRPKTLTHIETCWLKLINQFYPKKTLVLIANKIDKPSAVSQLRGRDFAFKHNLKYIETSARSSLHIDALLKEGDGSVPKTCTIWDKIANAHLNTILIMPGSVEENDKPHPTLQYGLMTPAVIVLNTPIVILAFLIVLPAAMLKAKSYDAYNHQEAVSVKKIGLGALFVLSALINTVAKLCILVLECLRALIFDAAFRPVYLSDRAGGGYGPVAKAMVGIWSALLIVGLFTVGVFMTGGMLGIAGVFAKSLVIAHSVSTATVLGCNVVVAATMYVWAQAIYSGLKAASTLFSRPKKKQSVDVDVILGKDCTESMQPQDRSGLNL